jgi:hypothetical protein
VGIGLAAGLIIFAVDWRRRNRQLYLPAVRAPVDAPDSAPPSGVVRFGMIVFAAIVVMSGIALLTVKFGELRTARKSTAWPSTAGHMVRVSARQEVSEKRSASPKFIVLCTYRYRVGDRMYEGTRWRFGSNTVSKNEVEKFKDEHRTGSEVQVYYDPTNPEESTLEAETPKSLYAAVAFAPVLIIGGIFGLYALIFAK